MIKPGNSSYDLDATLLGMLLGMIGKEREQKEGAQAAGLSSRGVLCFCYIGSLLFRVERVYIELRNVLLGPKSRVWWNLVLCANLSPKPRPSLVMSCLFLPPPPSPSAPFPPPSPS